MENNGKNIKFHCIHLGNINIIYDIRWIVYFFSSTGIITTNSYGISRNIQDIIGGSLGGITYTFVETHNVTLNEHDVYYYTFSPAKEYFGIQMVQDILKLIGQDNMESYQLQTGMHNHSGL